MSETKFTKGPWAVDVDIALKSMRESLRILAEEES